MPLIFLKPITITHQGFLTAVERKKLHGWRSKEITEVLNLLRSYPNPSPTFQKHIALALAVSKWREEKPEEFRKRDERSNGMCSKLAIELGDNTLRENDGTVLFTMQPQNKNQHLNGSDWDVLPQQAANLLRYPPTVTYYNEAPTAVMAKAKFQQPEYRKLGVIMVDCDGGDNTHGYNKKWLGQQKQTVLQYMVAVLQKAREMNVPVMEFWKAQNPGEPNTNVRLKNVLGQMHYYNVTTVRKPSGNGFVHTGLDIWLKLNQIKTVVVMGYQANMCVAATIFGSVEDFVRPNIPPRKNIMPDCWTGKSMSSPRAPFWPLIISS
jgi:hypothetical protein